MKYRLKREVDEDGKPIRRKKRKKDKKNKKSKNQIRSQTLISSLRRSFSNRKTIDLEMNETIFLE